MPADLRGLLGRESRLQHLLRDGGEKPASFALPDRIGISALYIRFEVCIGADSGVVDAGGVNHALDLLDIFLRRVAYLFFAQKARRHIRDLVRFTGSWQRTGVGEDHGLS